MGTPAKHPRDAAAASRIPQRLQDAVATVSTAQILRGSGYSAAEAAALRALSDIAGRYIESLGRAAAALAEAQGRTEPNVADVVLALEDHAPGGFPGASDPTRPVLCSGALAELAGFVDAVTEVPFAKPLPRRDLGSGAGKGWESFATAEQEPPLSHVPRWLPRFPEGWEEQRLRGRVEAAAKDDEDTGEVMTVMPNGVVIENGKRAAVPENREKVSFRLPAKRRRPSLLHGLLGARADCGPAPATSSLLPDPLSTGSTTRTVGDCGSLRRIEPPQAPVPTVFPVSVPPLAVATASPRLHCQALRHSSLNPSPRP